MGCESKLLLVLHHLRSERRIFMKAAVKKCCYFLVVFCCSLSMLLFSPPKEAEAGDARDNIYAADGTVNLRFYARHITASDIYLDRDRLSRDAKLEHNYMIVRPQYYKTIGNFGATVQLLLPFGDIEESSTARTQNASGMMDPTLILGFWPIASEKHKFWLFVGEHITAPLGSYDNTKLSLGTNRWAFKTAAGIVKGWGNFYFDLETSIEFYEDNDEFLASGTATKVDQEMDHVFRLESHISYDFTPEFRLSLDYYHEKGGEKSYRHPVTNLKVKSNEKDNHALQLSAFIQLAPKHQLALQYMWDLKVKNGFETDMIGLRYSYTF